MRPGARAQRRRGSPFRKGFPRPAPHERAPAIGEIRKAIERENPGRVSNWETPYVPPPKLTVDETPYRSRVYVLERETADGNSYAEGDPIPEIEAVRQGIPLIADPLLFRDEAPRVPCPRCEGSGKRARMKGHKNGCGCPGCKPCPECQGTRYVTVAALPPNPREKNLDVDWVDLRPTGEV